MEFDLDPYFVEVATAFGPRVTGLRLGGLDNVLAALSPTVVVGPDANPYRFHGGHRVWASPEIPEITYSPDDFECAVNADARTVVVSARPDRAGIVKELTVSAQGVSLLVVNRLLFTRDLGRRMAAWAITQFPYGGTAIMPVTGEPTGPEPNRSVVLWPYTSLADPRLTLTDSAVLVEASGEIPVKVGTGPSPGKLGYLRDGLLFSKTVEPAGGGNAPDRGAVGQVFVGDGFCELESVGRLRRATEGAIASVSEVWTLVECADLDTALELVVGATGE